MLSEWVEKVRPLYSSVELVHDEVSLTNEGSPFVISEERYVHVTQVRQKGLDRAREMGAQYLLVSCFEKTQLCVSSHTS